MGLIRAETAERLERVLTSIVALKATIREIKDSDELRVLQTAQVVRRE